MAVSGIRVAGLKCFSGAREVDLVLDPEPGWTVLAGPNGSGKSTLLQAIAAALGAYEPADPQGWLASGHGEGMAELVGLGRWTLSATGPTRTAERPAARYLAADRRPPATLPAAALDRLTDGVLPSGWRPDTGRPIADLGSGVASLAALVAELSTLDETLDEDDVATVLIDDVDVHLHPVWQQRIGGWLTTHFPRLQFIVATHSPYVCQAADPGALVRLFGPDEEPAPPQRLDEELHQRVLYGSGDDTVLSELFGLPSAYSPNAEAERELLIRLERKLYSGQASAAEVLDYQRLGAKLNSSLTARADEIAARQLGRDR